MKTTYSNFSKALRLWTTWTEDEQWLFCAFFPLVLNLASIAAWGMMHKRGSVSLPLAWVTVAYLLGSLFLSGRALLLERRDSKRRSVGEPLRGGPREG